MATPPTELVVYAIRNSAGEWFRAKGFGGYGKSWVPDINNAKLYLKLSQARSRITYFSNNNPENLPAPELVEFRAVLSRVIAEPERLAKAKKKKELAEEQSRKRLAELELERAQTQLREAQAKIARLRGQP